MPITPKVSIIIPCYNSEPYIDDCLKSIFTQNYMNLEIIVIDDGSTDNSLKILESYRDKIILISQANSGACIARNKGLEIASGKYIKFLDSDDYLAPGIISSQVNKIEPLNNNEIVYGDFTLLYPSKSVLHKNKIISDTYTTEELINTDILTGTPLHRTSLLKTINGFDKRFKHGQEWNLHVRLAALGVKFIYYPENVYYYRIHNSEDRISNKKEFDAKYELEKCLMTLESIHNLGKIGSSVSDGMATKVWNIGRKMLLIASKNEAEYYFSYAKKISDAPLKFASKKYRMLHSILGTSFTELFISNINRLRNKRNIFKNHK